MKILKDKQLQQEQLQVFLLHLEVQLEVAFLHMKFQNQAPTGALTLHGKYSLVQVLVRLCSIYWSVQYMEKM